MDLCEKCSILCIINCSNYRVPSHGEILDESRSSDTLAPFGRGNSARFYESQIDYKLIDRAIPHKFMKCTLSITRVRNGIKIEFIYELINFKRLHSSNLNQFLRLLFKIHCQSYKVKYIQNYISFFPL